MINLNISILFHFICITIAIFIFQYFFDYLYDIFMNYKKEEALRLSIYDSKKLSSLHFREAIIDKEKIIEKELIRYVNMAIEKSQNIIIFNESVRCIIIVRDLTNKDKLEIEQAIERIVKRG